MALFLKRNTRIILRKPEGMSINRINAFSHNAMKIYFDKTMFIMKKHHLVGRQNFNLDES